MLFPFQASLGPLQLREWFRFFTALVTNVAMLVTPWQNLAANDDFPQGGLDGDMVLLAALLPERSEDFPRQVSSAPNAQAPRLLWQPLNTYWRSPEIRPAAPRAPFSLLSETFPAKPSPLLIAPRSDGFWQPGQILAGADPVPPAGLFGALPIEREAGNCVVFGEVASGLDPVVDAFVDIVGTGRVGRTDAQGRFRIEGLPAGDFTAEASALNYSPQVLGVSPNPTTPVELRFNLTLKPVESGTEEFLLDQEEVVGEYNESSQGDFNLTLATETPSIASGVNRDDFEKTAVGDAGEAIAKISGANIVDGKYAVVRGLADRYVSTLFNGAQVASADPSRKAIQLDLFPTSVIESIGVEKTYSSWLPADFGGGSIDIRTRAFPAERILEAKAEISFNDSLADTMYVHPNRELGFLGNVTHTLPTYLERENPPPGESQFIDSGNTTTEDLDRRWTGLHRSQSLRPAQDESEFGTSYGVTYGETYDIGGENRIGLIVALGQSSGDESNLGESISNPVRDYTKETYTRGVEWSAFTSAALELGDYHTLSASYFKKHIAEDTAELAYDIKQSSDSLRYGDLASGGSVDISDAYGGDAVYFGESWDIGTTLRDLDIFQFRGEHKLGETDLKLDWNVTTSGAEENRPYSTHYEYGVLDFTERALQPFVDRAFVALDDIAKNTVAPILGIDPATATWTSVRADVVDLIGEESTAAIEDNNGLPKIANGGVLGGKFRVPTLAYGNYVGARDGGQLSSRRSERTIESAGDQQVNLTYPIRLDRESEDRVLEFRVGARNFGKKRQTRTRLYDLVLRSDGGSGSGFPPGFFDRLSPDERENLGEMLALNPDLLANYFNGTDQDGPYYLNALSNRGVENVLTELEQRAFYASSRFQWDKAFIVAGARQETEDYKIDVLPSPESAFDDDEIAAFGWENRESQKDLLPSVAAGNSFFGDKLQVLAAWSETIARPTFWEFVPTVSVDQSTGLSRRGNSALFRTDITNTDLAFTWLPNDRMTLRTGFFHKNLVRPLVNFYEPTSDGAEILYKDAYIDSATGLTTEYTATISGIELEGELTELGPFTLKGNFTYIDAQLNYFYEVNGLPEPVTSQLPYQPKMILNGTLSHFHEPWNLTTSLVINYTGGYPVILKRNAADSEVTREALTTMDLVMTKDIERDGVDFSVGCGIKNLLSSEDSYIYNGRSAGRNVDGRTYWLELKASF